MQKFYGYVFYHCRRSLGVCRNYFCIFKHPVDTDQFHQQPEPFFVGSVPGDNYFIVLGKYFRFFFR